MSRLSHTSFIVITFCLLLAACDPGSQRRLDRETLEREMRNREPRRIKEAEILDAALAQGQEISRVLRSNTDSLNNAAANNCCPALPPAILDSLRRHYSASVVCYSIETPAPQADSLELQLLEAYRYSLEQNLPLKDNIQAYGNDRFLYSTPTPASEDARPDCAVWLIYLNRKQVVLSME